ncbi:MAG: RidA family protein [Alphaproteobacteria bacterium]|nr:RidA family protein [Alphaproteobacteria bacterium]
MIEERLSELGLELPESAPPLFNYVPFVIAGNLVFVAGQVPIGGAREYKGKVGVEIDMETAQEAARQCALNILTQIRDAVNGDWDRVQKCVKLGGFVNCGPDFTDMSLVINGASDLMVEVLGEEKGKHARFAVGAPCLPADFSVEIDAVFEIKP